MIGLRLSKTGSWGEARRRFEAASRDVKGRLLLAIRRAALLLEAEIKKGLAGGSPGGTPFQALALSTVLQRRAGSSRPLLDKGGLLGAITTKVDAGGPSAFVGVLRTARGPGGGNMVNVAEIHEFGTKPFAIKVTPALRTFFLHLSLASGGRISPLSSSTTVIHHPGIPARPFIRPVFDAIRPRLERELRLALERG